MLHQQCCPTSALGHRGQAKYVEAPDIQVFMDQHMLLRAATPISLNVELR